jgi:hypothetical protein
MSNRHSVEGFRSTAASALPVQSQTSNFESLIPNRNIPELGFLQMPENKAHENLKPQQNAIFPLVRTLACGNRRRPGDPPAATLDIPRAQV